MVDELSVADRFEALHHGPGPLLLPNPWDVGSARLFASLGFQALATTRSRHARPVGWLDVSRDEVLAHAAAIAGATDLPVNGDFESGFADDAAGVAETVTMALGTGLAGLSIEDYDRDGDAIYDAALAADRVNAAADAAHGTGGRLLITGRAENYLHGRPDLADTIARLQAIPAARADVVYAPGVTTAADIRSVVTSVDVPVNVLALPGVPSVAELAELGVARISVGGAFAWVALGAVADSARSARARTATSVQVNAGRQAARTACAPHLTGRRSPRTSPMSLDTQPAPWTMWAVPRRHGGADATTGCDLNRPCRYGPPRRRRAGECQGDGGGGGDEIVGRGR